MDLHPGSNMLRLRNIRLGCLCVKENVLSMLKRQVLVFVWVSVDIFGPFMNAEFSGIVVIGSFRSIFTQSR